MAETIPTPTADEMLIDWANSKAKKTGSTTIPANQKLAVVVLELAPAVTPADYPALGAAIKAISGIQDVDLLIDGQSGDAIVGQSIKLFVTAHRRYIENPQEPE